MTTNKAPIKELPVAEIEATAATQVRVGPPNSAIVKEYGEAMLAGQIFPPIVVFAENGSERYLLSDGFQRLAAAIAIGHETIACIVKEGGVRDALEHALSANDEHGLRRTNKDKRNAVMLALKDPEWSQWSKTDIARLCRVSDKTVAKVREDMVLSGEIDEQQTVKTRRHGKVVKQKAKQTSSESRTKSGEGQEKQPHTGAKNQDQVNAAEFFALLDNVKGIPHDGAEAARRWGLHHRLSDLNYLMEWINEAITESLKATNRAA